MDLKTLLACFMGRHHRYRLADVDFTTLVQACEEHGEDKPPRPEKRGKKAAKPKTPNYRRLDHDKLPRGMLKSLTFDNGKEFAAFKHLEQALGIKVYFAKPYHSWERGTNENRNGIVRMVLPKGRTFDDILEDELKGIACPGGRAPPRRFAAPLTGTAMPALPDSACVSSTTTEIFGFFG